MSGHYCTSNFQWSVSANSSPYGWGIVATAKWCHWRKKERCTVPFPKGELCTIENCPMRPQDFADMFPEDYQELENKNAALLALAQYAQHHNDCLGDLPDRNGNMHKCTCGLDEARKRAEAST